MSNNEDKAKWHHVNRQPDHEAEPLPESMGSRIFGGVVIGLTASVVAVSGYPIVARMMDRQEAEPQPLVVAEATVRVISADPANGLILSKAVQRTVCKEVPDLIKQWQPVDGQGTIEDLEKALTNECVGVADRLMDQSGGAQNLADKFLNIRLIDYSKGNDTPTIEVNIVE